MPSEKDSSSYVLVMEAGNQPERLVAKLHQVYSLNPVASKILVVFEPGGGVKLPPFPSHRPVVMVPRLFQFILPHINQPWMAYLPANAPYSPPLFDSPGIEKKDFSFLQPWIPVQPLKETDGLRQNHLDLGWLSTKSLVEEKKWEVPWSLLEWERVSQKGGVWPPYGSACAQVGLKVKSLPLTTALSRQSKILALMPYYHCEPYLEQALDSLVHQTHPPQAIAVLDDASPRPPLEILRKFPQVTLLQSSQNVGPYRLLQSVIEKTRFDGYLFQDSDDWSSLDRLERLLEEAEKTGAEWVGTQELMFLENSIHAVRYPLNLEGIRQNALRHPFCYPSSLISRDFLMKLGGFATGLRFSGDWELLSRAVWTGKVVNLDRYCYFRRIRKDSLITSQATGLGSEARRKVDSEIEARKAENKVRVSQGQEPLLTPLTTLPSVLFKHLAGPLLVPQ